MGILLSWPICILCVQWDSVDGKCGDKDPRFFLPVWVREACCFETNLLSHIRCLYAGRGRNDTYKLFLINSTR